MKFWYTLLCYAASVAVFTAHAQLVKPIKVDQFGYITEAKKIAIISDAITGYNAADAFTPSPTLEVRLVSDNTTVFSGSAEAWNGGAEQSQSGDKVWWFDFSTVTQPGEYYIYDLGNNESSYTFKIEDCSYNEVLKQSLRTFYYQRCGIAKETPYAETAWADAIVCHKFANQDEACRYIGSKNTASSAKSLYGGWHDAGDYNKYVNYASEALHHLISAYEEKPAVWGDNFDIPESLNGIPDILDEIKWELDWLLRMQQSDGSVLHKVSVDGFQSASPPSADTTPRYYGTASTSATLAAAFVFAHAYLVYKPFNITNTDGTYFHNTLLTAAQNAWAWAEANPNVKFNNSGFNSAADEFPDWNYTYQLTATKVAAASYLYAATGSSTYKSYFETNYTNVHLVQWPSAYPYEPIYQDALLYYAHLSGVSSTVASNIKSSYTNSVKSWNPNNLAAYLNKTDAYRAHLQDGDYSWGSNRTKAQQALLFTNMLVYNMDPSNAANYRDAALGYVNYFHGVNPNAFTYLTNMETYGAENSVNEFYHSWFGHGTAWDNAKTSLYGPAPGFLPGGANPNFTPDWSYSGPVISPPQNQPIQKSYKDWNTPWPENSWEITENSIHNQSAYTRLLSHFATETSCFDPMPLEILKFEAHVQLNQVMLSWSAFADEAATFVIERSADGINYLEIGTEQAIVSSEKQHYQVWDKAPLPEANYYRLSYMEAQKQPKYSQVITINLSNVVGQALLTISPNPANQKLYVETPLKNMRLRISNLMGKTLLTQPLGNEVNINHLVAGLYIVQLIDKNGIVKASKKFVKK